MPNGLWYASGPYEMDEAIPSSAFSEGDVLVYDSNSSLSQWDITEGAGDIVGVAATDSLNSFNDKCSYVKALPLTVFWSIATAGSAFTAGEEVDVDVDAAGRPVLVTSANTARFVVELNTALLDDVAPSTQSRQRVRFLTHSGLVEHV
jgi:hypothetical protein